VPPPPPDSLMSSCFVNCFRVSSLVSLFRQCAPVCPWPSVPRLGPRSAPPPGSRCAPGLAPVRATSPPWCSRVVPSRLPWWWSLQSVPYLVVFAIGGRGKRRLEYKALWRKTAVSVKLKCLALWCKTVLVCMTPSGVKLPCRAQST